MIVSFTNLVAAALVTQTEGGEDANYPATNLKHPQRRYLPAKTTSTAQSRWVVDFGVAQALGFVELVRANFVTATIQGNATNVWTSPSYSTAITIAQNPFNYQYQYGLVPVGFTYRYLSVLVPTQTPIEAPLSVFRLGGIHAGLATVAPTGFSVDFDHVTEFPFSDASPSHEGWTQRSRLSNPLVTIKRKRGARFTHATPYIAGDEVRAWTLNVDYPGWTADFFALYEDLGNPSMAWLVRSVNGTMPWIVRSDLPGVADSDWTLREVTGP